MNAMTGFGPAVWEADIAAYPDAVRALMGPMTQVELEDDDFACLTGEAKAITPDSRDVLDEVLAGFQSTGAFLRLGLCSFKSGPGRLLPIYTGTQAALTLAQRNARVQTVARAMVMAKQKRLLYLRPYINIPRWSEFRIFIKNRSVIGISQYHCDQRYSQIHYYADQIENGIQVLLRHLLPALHVNDTVVDISIDPEQKMALLLELNPFVRRTGSGLFSWTKPGDFNGRMRIL